MMASEKRLIDAEELWKKFESEPWYDNADRDEIALPMVDDAPTVDAVEVVRCNDCRKWEYDENFSGWCTEWRRRTLGNHFCSYGERKDNENQGLCKMCLF